MSLLKKLIDQEPKHEYGLLGVRTFPWDGVNAPFGSGYCIVAPHSESRRHVNEPSDEEELFICIAGTAEIVVGEKSYMVERGDQIFIPNGLLHYVTNNTKEPFHFFTIWWNRESVRSFNQNNIRSHDF